MGEVIEKIEEFHNEGDGAYNTFEGFKITTNEQEVKLAISDDSNCCESWGFFLTEDDTGKFIGSELLAVSVTDTNRSTKTFKDYHRDNGPENIDLDEGDVLFVDIETNRGVLQFVAYNCHNGYYGHEAKVTSNQLTHSVGL